MKGIAPAGEETFDDAQTTEEAQAGADRREAADQASSLADLELRPGESAAIAMALDRCVDLLLIDERYGTRVARDLGLTTVGTVGILATAAGKGLVSLRKSFEALRATTFRGPDGLIDELLRMDESRR